MAVKRGGGRKLKPGKVPRKFSVRSFAVESQAEHTADNSNTVVNMQEPEPEPDSELPEDTNTASIDIALALSAALWTTLTPEQISLQMQLSFAERSHC